MEGKILFREGVEHIYSIAFDTLLLFGLTASPFWSTLVVNHVEFSVCRPSAKCVSKTNYGRR